MDNPAVTQPAPNRLEAIQPPTLNNGSPRPTPSPTSRGGKTPPNSQDTIPPSRNNHGWRRITRNFSPSWFSTTTGTGIVSTLLFSIPYAHPTLYYLSLATFLLNILLFTLAFTISVLRYTLWPEIWTVMIQDPVNSLFLGTIPMGFATIVQMWVNICVPIWGQWAVWGAVGMWGLDSLVAVSVTVSLGILLMSASHQRSLDSITAAQLLPIAATIVAAATGSNVAEVVTDVQVKLGVILASYVMWGMAVPMALSVLVVYYQRLALHKLPPREVIVSCFLPLGPLGLGGYCILHLGRLSLDVFPQTETLDPMAGRIAYILGFFVSLTMWSYGLIWFALALASIYKARPFPFNMGWWGFTFPLGVYSSSTILLGKELPSKFFSVLGTIFAVAVIVLWILIFVRTGIGSWNGKLFHAPCLAKLERTEPESPVVDNAELEGKGGVEGEREGVIFRIGTKSGS